ncbi:MAG: GIY-YIG nuclease family protein [Clostridia bacterium]|nr:GIY-YIG nuclease family protein [Clostridia bacterium]
MTAGIYIIKNVKTGQMLIGQSIDISRRFNQHKRSLEKGNHWNPFLQNSYNKYGKDCFSFKVLEEFLDDTPFLKEVLSDSEMYYILAYNIFNNKKHYNLTSGGETPRISEETKKRISEKMMGKKNHNYGKKLSVETRKKMSKSTKGKNHPMYNKKTPQKVKKKISLTCSKIRNTSGYYRVYKHKRKGNRKDRWVYQYYDEKTNKRISITSIDINKLKEKVIEKGLEWIEL